MKEREQTELTINTVNPTLEAGDIFMSETGGEIPNKEQEDIKREETGKEATPVSDRIEAAKNAWNILNKGRRISIDEKRTQGMLIERGIMPIQGGDFTDEENPNKEDGTKDTKNETPENKRIEDIIENSEDIYAALREIIDSSESDEVSKAIDANGENLIKFLTVGLPEESSKKILDELNEISELTKEERNNRFKEIIGKIGQEREKLGLGEPGIEKEKKEGEGNETPQTDGEGGDGEPPTSEAPPAPEEPEEPEGPKDDSKPEDERTLQDDINEVVINIGNLGKDPNSIYNLTNNSRISGMIYSAYGEKEFKAKKEEWEEIVRDFDAGDEEKTSRIQEKMTRFFQAVVNKININQREERGEALSHRITSVQELASWIIQNQDRELWAVDGVHPLLDEDGNFNQGNFLIWLREESVKHHENNPNSEMTPLSSVGISTDYRDISVYAMSLLKEQYMRDKKEGRVLKELANEMIWEGFMFGELRNMNLFYIQGMGDDKRISEVLQQVHGKNTLTRPGNLRMLMTMSEDFTEDKSKRDTRVGDAFRVATDIYYNISDAEALKEILGDKPITQEDFKNVFRILNNLKDWEENVGDFGEFKFLKEDPRGFSYFDHQSNTTKYLFNEDGSIDMNQFVSIMNFYNSPNEESTKMEFVRELVRLKAAQKADLKRPGIAFTEEQKLARKETFDALVSSLVLSGKTQEQAEAEATNKLMVERQAHRASLKFAEVMAFSMQRPYGSASKQDLGRAGYDAMTKMNVQEYLHKQASTNRGGAVGIPEQLGLFRDLSPDPITGIRTESGRSIYEVMKDLRDVDNGKNIVTTVERDGKKVEIQITKDMLLDEIKFKEYAEQYYARNQQVRAVQIFHTLSDAKALDLDKIVTYSYLEGIKYNVGEFQSQINEGIIKPFRYALINSNLNFAEEVRIYEQEQEVNGKTTPASYRTGTLAEKTLGAELYGKLQVDYQTQTDDRGVFLSQKYATYSEFLASYDAKVRMTKDSTLGIFAAQLRSHRKFGSLGESWGYHRTETFIDALKTIQDVEPDPEHPGRFKPAVDQYGRPKRYFSEIDFEWLRKNSGTEVWRMLMIDGMKKGGEALASGSWEALMRFIQALMK